MGKMLMGVKKKQEINREVKDIKKRRRKIE